LKRVLISIGLVVFCLAALLPTAQPHAMTATAAVTTASGAPIDVASAGIAPDVMRLALGAVSCATKTGDIKAPSTLTVIDYSLPSVDRRLWVFDLTDGTLLFKELVAHGRNTGDNMATRFSDAMNSRQSSIGLFVTADTYVGNNGYSLRLDGLERGFNANARDRAIVMHGASYVDAKLAATQGRIGRSWGCPALREAVARQVIDVIRGGGVVFSYYPDSNWLKSSRFLNGCA
jgi:L,D-transpeptidase-like protein